LLYGRDPQLPTEAALCPPTARSTICLDDYKTELVQNMSRAWQLAQNVIRKSQNRQKATHDKKASDATVKLGDRVFVYMPAIRTGPAYKLARPYKGPYRIIKTHENGVELQSIEHPRAKTIRVALNRVRRCPTAISDKEEGLLSPTTNECIKEHEDDEIPGCRIEEIDPQDDAGGDSTDPPKQGQTEMTDRWRKRLRPCGSRTPAVEEGEM